jgi:hypothetical protein
VVLRNGVNNPTQNLTEANVFALEQPERSTLIDGAIGESSIFQESLTTKRFRQMARHIVVEAKPHAAGFFVWGSASASISVRWSS